ncbi:MAG: hypothetical protein ACRDIY_14285 [Chloroflexota bacterium]
MVVQERPLTDRKPGALIDLHILIYWKDGDWYAECLDLDLLTARTEPLAAYRELMAQVKLYLQSAHEAGQWDSRVPRPAPFTHWLRYLAVAAIQAFPYVLGHRQGTLTTFHLPVDTSGNPIGA